jgi:hypothetical protein
LIASNFYRVNLTLQTFPKMVKNVKIEIFTGRVPSNRIKSTHTGAAQAVVDRDVQEQHKSSCQYSTASCRKIHPSTWTGTSPAQALVDMQLQTRPGDTVGLVHKQTREAYTHVDRYV